MSKSVFVSHATQDGALVRAFVDFLVDGIGVPVDEVFCSSLPDFGIPAGQNFVEHMRTQLDGSLIVIMLMSPSYMASGFCQAEMGAAWVKAKEVFPIVVPPTTFQEVKGVMLGKQAINVSDDIRYNELRDKLAELVGFLAAAFDHMKPQTGTVEKREILQRKTLRGGEDSSLPFLLAQMNLLLHGIEAPDIEFGNALRFKLTEIGERDRVEVILTNPPFGGEEEAGILANFPEDRRTAETALLFLQLIMRRLKRGGLGRAGVVVPHGILFGDGIAARIKADLLEQFNLHTVVRLPEGTFSPYTDIPTNILFFDTSGPTREIWYWEQTLPEGRRKYSKTHSLQYEDLADCVAWWPVREDGPRAWKTFGPDLIKRDDQGRVIAVDLDVRNPHAKDTIDHRPPEQIIKSAIAKEQQLLDVLEELRAFVAGSV